MRIKSMNVRNVGANFAGDWWNDGTSQEKKNETGFLFKTLLKRRWKSVTMKDRSIKVYRSEAKLGEYLHKLWGGKDI